MRRLLILSILCLSLSTVQAKNNGFRVNGYSIYKEVTEIIFEDSRVLLKWNDSSISSDFCARTMYELLNADRINDAHIYAASGLQGDNITVDGLEIGTKVFIYDMNGRQLIVQPVSQKQTSVNLSNLNTGIYLLKNQNTIMKFVKR
jgi:hypothetical protein